MSVDTHRAYKHSGFCCVSQSDLSWVQKKRKAKSLLLMYTFNLTHASNHYTHSHTHVFVHIHRWTNVAK